MFGTLNIQRQFIRKWSFGTRFLKVNKKIPFNKQFDLTLHFKLVVLKLDYISLKSDDLETYIYASPKRFQSFIIRLFP